MAELVKHTAGPWIAGEPSLDYERGRVYSSDVTGSIVAECGRFQFAYRPWPEIEANARLIAAAPDLLAALKTMRCPSCGYLLDGARSVAGPCPYCVEARAAIAKAEGATATVTPQNLPATPAGTCPDCGAKPDAPNPDCAMCSQPANEQPEVM